MDAIRFQRLAEAAGVEYDLDAVFGSEIRGLLTTNQKVEKGEKQGWLTAIMHLSPAKASGFQVCSSATKGCEAACLNTAGRGGIWLKIPAFHRDSFASPKARRTT